MGSNVPISHSMLKASKMDQYCEGTSLVIAHTGSATCPVSKYDGEVILCGEVEAHMYSGCNIM